MNVKKYILEILVFICGAMIMILELVASRILAPYFGTSSMVWTVIIGMILFCCSTGNYIGGVVSDKKPEIKVLSGVLLVASVWILILPPISKVVLNFIEQNIRDIRIGAVISTLILFLVPTMLLGVISPFAVRLKMKELELAGKTVGKLSALSTIGSIVGTFLAGFILIPTIGSTQILYIIGSVLMILSILLYNFNIKKVVAVFLITLFFTSLCSLGMAFMETSVILDTDSEYGRIQIKRYKYLERDINALLIDKGFESAMYIDSPKELVFNYTKYYDLMNYFCSDIKSTLLIGGAAYSYPKYYLDKYDDRIMDVVEIDPKVTEIAKQYFNLEVNDRIKIYHQDGRIYLNKSNKKYDVILNDAYKGVSTPFHLTTKEIADKVYASLEENGVYLSNIITSLDGEKSKILKSEVKTLEQTFQNVYLFVCEDLNNTDEAQNVMVVATKDSNRKEISLTSNEEINIMLKNYYEIKDYENAIVLTDEYAPVDYYIREILY